MGWVRLYLVLLPSPCSSHLLISYFAPTMCPFTRSAGAFFECLPRFRFSASLNRRHASMAFWEQNSSYCFFSKKSGLIRYIPISVLYLYRFPGNKSRIPSGTDYRKFFGFPDSVLSESNFPAPPGTDYWLPITRGTDFCIPTIPGIENSWRRFPGKTFTFRESNFRTQNSVS